MERARGRRAHHRPCPRRRRRRRRGRRLGGAPPPRSRPRSRRLLSDGEGRPRAGRAHRAALRAAPDARADPV
ncbi:MAG: hypothetical protein DME01_19060 [Candidatus Rokuibacteriota bacterium]|nr:MAG: hypothetical protein DME01_19060 [Candidatus Rokubacteria bacterium]